MLRVALTLLEREDILLKPLFMGGCHAPRRYLVWVNDVQYWHRTLRSARARVMLRQRGGNDTLVRCLEASVCNWWLCQPHGWRAA